MTEVFVQTSVWVIAGMLAGSLLSWLIRGKQANRELDRLADEWQSRLDDETRQMDRLTAEGNSLRAALESTQASLQQNKHAAAKAQTELESMRERLNALSKDLFNAGVERDALNNKLVGSAKILQSAKQRIAEITNEFGKSREFYKGQLMSAFEQRQSLERKVEDARSEHESLSNQLTSARAEHRSVSNALATAQVRLENLDALEQQLISLEADNAQLRHDIEMSNKQAESLQRDAREADAIKEQNRELAHCLESMESSRRQYEDDARRYREQHSESEQESETLRIKLGDIQKRLTEMQEAHEDARRAVAEQRSTAPQFGMSPQPDGDVDDLTEIVGIGKVFEAMLHRLGIYYFRQIAAFGPAELARVNAELKEFKGRIEHDDWIGQARELHFKKYGSDAVGH